MKSSVIPTSTERHVQPVHVKTTPRSQLHVHVAGIKPRLTVIRNTSYLSKNKDYNSYDHNIKIIEKLTVLAKNRILGRNLFSGDMVFTTLHVYSDIPYVHVHTDYEAECTEKFMHAKFI